MEYVLEHVKDIVFRHVGIHANRHVLIIALGDVIRIAEVDVSRSVVKDVLDVHHVQDHVKDNQQEKVDALDVVLKLDVLLIVSMIVIRIAWDGVVDQFAV